MIILALIGTSVAGFMLYKGITGGSSSGGTWTADSADMNPSTTAFMDRLASASGVPLVVTSGDRSPEAQASAMIAKRRAGTSDQGFRDLYNDAAINEILAAPESQWASVIRAQAARGAGISPHLRGAGLDLRSYTLNAAQIAKVIAVAKAIGASAAFLEDNPAHIHITIGGTATQLAAERVGWSWGQIALAGVGVTASVLAIGFGAVTAFGVFAARRILHRKNGRRRPQGARRGTRR